MTKLFKAWYFWFGLLIVAISIYFIVMHSASEKEKATAKKAKTAATPNTDTATGDGGTTAIA
ncbi:MAG: hypothetical protein EBX41_00815 [Chitinophagia bacterium]|nr:hypothetical protein [Chitinophagia bacterium]